MKDKKKIMLVKIAVPVLVIGGLVGGSFLFEAYASNSSNKPIVVSKEPIDTKSIDDKPLQVVQRWQSTNIPGLSQIFGITLKDEILVGIGLSKEEFEDKYKNIKSEDINTEDQYNKLYDDLYGKLYNLNVKSQKKSLIKSKNKEIQTKDMEAGLNQDGRYINYDKNNNQYMCNLSDGNEVLCNNSKNEMWSKDGQYLIGHIENKIYVYDIKKNITRTSDIDKTQASVQPEMYSEDGKTVYFIGEQSKKKNDSLRREGIFKVNTKTNSVEEIVMLPYRNMTDPTSKEEGILNFQVLNGGKKLILNATINGDSGVYIYDIDSKKFFKVIDTIKTKEGDYCINFVTSPDGEKIAYINKSKENANTDKWNLYVAKLNENGIGNRITIDKDIKLGGSTKSQILWSDDSKRICFFKESGITNKNGFYISGENYINIIKFK